MKKPVKAVAIGGGTGLSVVLKSLVNKFDISAIIAMTDDGLSTGRIRKDFKVLPSGDIRKCLIALSDQNSSISKIFDYRFQKSKGLKGHSLGNLIILALEKIYGNYQKGVFEASKLLNIKGQIIPSTFDDCQLGGILKNKKTIVGERKLFLAGMKNKIQKVWLVPEKVTVNPLAISEIKKADLIILGPGSLYTSIIPNLLIKEIPKAILNNKRALKIYICNVSTERGETQGLDVIDHIKKMFEYGGDNIFDICLVNSKVILQSKKQYKLGEINNITSSLTNFKNTKIISSNVINTNDPLYHDHIKLGKTLVKIYQNEK